VENLRSSRLRFKSLTIRIYLRLILFLFLYGCETSLIRIIKSRGMRWAGLIARIGNKRNVYRLLVGKPVGERPLGRPRRRWIDNSNMDILVMGLGDIDWIGVAQNRWRGEEFLRTRQWTFALHKMLGNYRMAAHLVASWVVLSSTEFVSLITVSIMIYDFL
jgi:hypothetical protein